MSDIYLPHEDGITGILDKDMLLLKTLSIGAGEILEYIQVNKEKDVMEIARIMLTNPEPEIELEGALKIASETVESLRLMLEDANNAANISRENKWMDKADFVLLLAKGVTEKIVDSISIGKSWFEEQADGKSLHKVDVEIKYAGYEWVYETTDYGDNEGLQVSGFKLNGSDDVNLKGDSTWLDLLFGNIAIFMRAKQAKLLLPRNFETLGAI